MRSLLFLLVLLAPSTSLAQTGTSFQLEPVAEGLSSPVLVAAPDGDPRLFIVEQSGLIRLMVDGELLEAPFLDLTQQISVGGEQGLLGLAFHPDYAANGRFFVNYTDPAGDTRVVGYTVSADSNVAEPSSADELLAVDQPYANHNGGWLDFGPEGLLYVALGDGGAGGDPHGHGQNPDSALGKILRLDVENNGASEVFALGVRNPWRNDFDEDLIYIADVGQGAWEEINVVSVAEAGANLGWNIMEGEECFENDGCDKTGFTLPVFAYGHDEGCSVTGGYVYRGSAIPALAGHYVFADYCAGVLRSFRYADGAIEDVADYGEAFGSLGNVTSFGEDGAGELYITLADGRVLKLVPASP